MMNADTGISEISREWHKTLKQRIAEYYGENYDPSKIREELQEVDWGKPVGEEIW